MPSVQQFRYLVAVTESLHFRRAAEACQVSQPTLSAQLKELERELGVQLLERSRARVVVTPVGARIVERAKSILRDVAEIQAIAKTGQAMLEDTIKIGVVQSLGSYFMPLVVPDLHESHPKLRLYLREELPDTLLRGLEEGTLDALVFPMPLPSRDLVTTALFREPLLVVAPHDHVVAKTPAVHAADLRDETILTLESGHKLYEQVRALCDSFGAKLSHDYEGTSLDTLRQMVAMGMGLSLLPALYVKSEVAREDLVVARPFHGAAPSRTIGLVWRKGTARQSEYEMLADLFRKSLRAHAPEVLVLA